MAKAQWSTHYLKAGEETGEIVNNVSMPLRFGQNLNIATGGSASYRYSVIMKEQVLFNTTTNIVNEGTL
jgi:hypothetical protein